MLLVALGMGRALAADDVTPPAPVATPPTPLVQEPVTLSARNLEIQEVLAMLSRSRNLNIICGPDVQGTVSIELRAVPFTEALQAVVAMAGMEVTRRGSIYFVRQPAGDDPAAAALCETRSFRLDYAQPEEIQAVIEQILSPAGKAMSYTPRRTLVVEDRPEVLERIDALLRTLDVAPRQVMIEARILEARLGRDMQFGIDWSLLFTNAKQTGDGLISIEGFAGEPNTGAGPAAFLTWAEGDFMAAIQSLEGVETLNTLACPRLLAVDGADARIIIGGQLGFFVTTTVENTILQSVQFLDTGTQLRITPTIAGDGYVRMTIHPELSDGAIDNGLPAKNTTEVTTDVLIRDGQTLLIGGLIRERDETTRKGIPLLMRLPILGALFGTTTHSLARSELIALITPHIIPTGGNVPYEGLGMVPPPTPAGE
jgi:type II secretory pathway component GspD/PulD (secretin)